MTLPRRRILLLGLAVLILAGAGIIICKKTMPGKTPYPCYADKGYMLSTRSCLQIDDYSPVTKEEAIEFAQDLSMLLIDNRLHSGGCEPIQIETTEIKLGWKIRLYLPNSQDQWVDISVGRTNGLGSIKSHGNNFHGSPALDRNIRSSAQRTIESIGGEDRTFAALAAMDTVRVLGNQVAGIYPTKALQQTNGDWLVTIGDIDCSEAFWEIRLTDHYTLLDYSYSWGF